MDQFENEVTPSPEPSAPPSVAIPEPVAPTGSFQKPADYYSSPPAPAGTSGCPKWVPLGCGLGGCLVLVLMFAGSAWVMKQGGGKLLSFVFSQIRSEMPAMLDSDVTEAQKEELDQQFAVLVQKIELEQVNLVSIQPMLQILRTTMSDSRIDSSEADQLIQKLRELNSEEPAPVRKSARITT